MRKAASEVRPGLGRSLACLQRGSSDQQTNTSPWHGPEEEDGTPGGTKREERGGVVPARLCAFGRNDTSQTQAVAKPSVKSGTKGFTGLEGIRLTPPEPWWCARTCAVCLYNTA